MKRAYLLAATCVAILCPAAQAGNLKLSGKQHWLQLASTANKDEAIGIARSFIYSSDDVKTVHSKDGLYQAVAGPYDVATIAELLELDKDKNTLGPLPKDASMTDGEAYTDTVWDSKQSAPTVLSTLSIEAPTEFKEGTFTAKVQGKKLGEDNAYVSAEGGDHNAQFQFDIGKDLKPDDLAKAEEFLGMGFHQAGTARLVPGSASPVLVITNNSGGMHCCTKTSFISRDPFNSKWNITTGDVLDGDAYTFEDLDGDGAKELVSIDNRFLYAFDSYAGSTSPIKIQQLMGAEVIDATLKPEFLPRLKQDLYGMEWTAKLAPESWTQNGFLAGWVAAKIRLGQGDEAWEKFLASYDKRSEFGPQICTSGESVDDCPDGNLKAVPIPKALAQFLKNAGYVPLPKAAEAELTK